MGYFERLFAGSSPLEIVRDSFIHIHAWLSERRVDSDEAELLADMTRKVDWGDDVEKDEFAKLLEYFSGRSSMSEDLSWAEVVGLHWIWPHYSDCLSYFSILRVFARLFLI